MNGKVFVLYDGRAKCGDAEDAVVLDQADSEKLARKVSWDHQGVDAVWYEYDVLSKELVNEKMRPDIGMGILA